MDTFSKTAIVVLTIGSENEQFGASNELNILKAVDELGVGKFNGIICLKNRNESWFLPPPGGAHTGSIVISTTCLKNNFVLS